MLEEFVLSVFFFVVVVVLELFFFLRKQHYSQGYTSVKLKLIKKKSNVNSICQAILLLLLMLFTKGLSTLK